MTKNVTLCTTFLRFLEVVALLASYYKGPHMQKAGKVLLLILINPKLKYSSLKFKWKSTVYTLKSTESMKVKVEERFTNRLSLITH